MPVNYDSSFHTYDQTTVTFDGTQTISAIGSASLGGIAGTAVAGVSNVVSASASLGDVVTSAIATIIPIDKPAISGGRVFIQPNLRPFINPESPKIIDKSKSELKLKPATKSKPIKIVKTSASVTLIGTSAKAVGILSWIAELDDIEVLELL